MRRAMSLGASVVVAAGMLVALAVPALAHEHRHVAGHEFTVGWSQEPSFTGFKNGVSLLIADEAGNPVEDAQIQVEVIFGQPDGTQKTEPMDMEASDENPGEYDAALIPTRPGTFTFHFTGTIGSAQVDETFTSSESTFDDVIEPTSREFPAQDPPSGQLSDKIDRVDARLASVQDTATSAAKSAKDAATTARLLAVVGLALAVVALVLALVLPRSLARRRLTT